MNRQLAQILSVAFHPAMMPSLAYAFILYFCDTAIFLSDKSKLYFLGFVIAFTLILPINIIYILKRSDVISSVYLENRKERPIPFVIATLYLCFFSYIIVFQQNMSALIDATIVSITITLALTTLITFFYKISMHATAVSGVLAVLVVTYFAYSSFELLHPILLLLLMTGGTMTARLAVNAHTMGQVVSGMLMGSLSCGFCMYFLVG